MNFKDYKAGQWVRQYEYKSFSPSLVNQEWTWDDPRINLLLEQAAQALAGLNAFSLIIPNVELFIRMHVAKEATTSSSIEGTQTGMEEAVSPKELVAPERRDDWQEVQNYIEAMDNSIEQLARLPLSNRLIKRSHAILMRGVRGETKSPGEFRKSQNWIGGSGPSDAAFVPPSQQEVIHLMSDLESFWHNEHIIVPELVRAAISHYQFETIHPFLDGNGRMGRLLITLHLLSKGLLRKPTLYLSAYLENHKVEYFNALTTVRATNDIGHWVRFFLVAVRDTARKGEQTFEKIVRLRKEVDQKILKIGRKAENAQRLLGHLYERPFVTVGETADLLGVQHQTANSLIKDFIGLGILQERTGFRRNRFFEFTSYFSLFLN